MLRASYIVIFIFLSLLLKSQVGPGGIGNSGSNVLWLDANKGVSLSVLSVTSWLDQSGNNFTATPSSVLARPLYLPLVANGYPAIDFDGIDDELWVHDNNALDLTQWHFFIVPIVKLQKNYNAWLTKGNDGQENFEMLSFADGNLHTPTFYTDNTRSTPNAPTGLVTTTEFNILEYSYSASIGRDIYKNGTSVYTDDENKTPATNNFSLYIGNEKTQSRFIDGRMAEVIMYNTVLNAAQRIIVNNYLASKYNCSIGANDLYTQDNVGNGNYDHDVSGIGRVNSSNVHTDSKGRGVVRILNPSGLNDNEFYFWGHDNGALGTFPITLDFPSTQGVQARIARVWRGSEVGNITNFEIRFDLSGMGAITASELRLLIDTDNDGTFADETTAGGGVIGSAVTLGGNSFGFTNVTGLNNNIRFTLGTSNTASTPLPIELLEFEARNQKNQVMLNWSTVSEKNSDYFIVERSRNGIDYKELSRIKAQGNSTAKIDYNYNDKDPVKGICYYRLKQVDTDKSFDYSPVVSVNNPATQIGFVLSPNPSSGEINMDLSAFVGRSVSYSIKGAAGRIVASDELLVSHDEKIIHINQGHSFLPGFYIVTLTSPEGIFSQKLIIK